MADAESYREKAEVRKWQKRDPIRILDEYLVKGGLVARRELHEIQKQVELQVQDAVVFADTSPFPSLDTLFQNIYSTPLHDRGGAISGPEVVIPELLTRKAARLTQTAEERSRRQPALSSLDVAEDSGGPGGRPMPAEAAQKATRAQATKGEGEGGETALEGDPGEPDSGSPAVAPGDQAAPPASRRAAPRSRRLPMPGRPGGRTS